MINGLLALLFCAFNTFALPKVTTETINGFQVDFVDIGAGDSLATMFSVPVGTMHESGSYMGGKHLLEHLTHVGTKKFPGYETFNNMLKRAGVNTNAMTSANQTFFYAHANSNAAELMLKVHMSMLGGLEWNPETIAKEKEVVIQEVAGEYMPQESEALLQMPFTKLLNPRHPWNHPSLGDRDSLTKLRLQDLQELYYTNYTPEFVRVALIGNFSNPGFLEQVKGWTKQYLQPANAQADGYYPWSRPMPNRRYNSLFSADHNPPESDHRLYIHTPGNSTNNILLEAPTSALPKNREAIDLLNSYLQLSVPGTLLHKLKTELEWVAGCGIYGYTLNNRYLLKFTCWLTEKGRGHEIEINEMFFAALHSLQNHPPDQTFLNAMIESGVKSFELSGSSVATFMNAYRGIMLTKLSLMQGLKDHQSVTVKDLQIAARAFRPDQALYFSSGPEVPDMELDKSAFNRKFKLEANSGALRRYMDIYLDDEKSMVIAPDIRKVDLGTVPEKVERKFLRNKQMAGASEKVIADLRSDLPDAATKVILHLAPTEGADLVAADIVMRAFADHFTSELTYLGMYEAVGFDVKRIGPAITLESRGQDVRSARALSWRLNRLGEYVPVEAELRRAREAYVGSRRAEFNSTMTAPLTISAVRAKRDPLEVPAIKAASIAETMNINEIIERWNKLRQRANLEVIAAGAFTELDVEALLVGARKIAPGKLTAEEVQKVRNRHKNLLDGQKKETGHFDAPKGEGSFGLSRVYHGPPVEDLREGVAFQVLNSVLSNEVGNHNRSFQQLGYIHSTAVGIPTQKHWTFNVFGGVDSAQQRDLTETGWEHVFNRLRNGDIDDAKIQDSIDDILNSKSQQNTSANDFVQEYEAGLYMLNDHRANQRELEILKKLTPQDVRDVAMKYILAPNTPFYQLTLGNCEEALTN